MSSEPLPTSPPLPSSTSAVPGDDAPEETRPESGASVGGKRTDLIRRRCPIKTHKTVTYPKNLTRFVRSVNKLPDLKHSKPKQGTIMKRLKMCRRTCKYGPRTPADRCPTKRSRGRGRQT